MYFLFFKELLYINFVFFVLFFFNQKVCFYTVNARFKLCDSLICMVCNHDQLAVSNMVLSCQYDVGINIMVSHIDHHVSIIQSLSVSCN